MQIETAASTARRAVGPWSWRAALASPAPPTNRADKKGACVRPAPHVEATVTAQTRSESPQHGSRPAGRPQATGA